MKIEGTGDQDLKDKIAEAESAGIVIGDQTIPFDKKTGKVSGGLEVANFRPYVGLGFGRAVLSKRLNVSVELGVQFHGRPEVYTNTGKLDLNSLGEDGSTFSDIIDKLKVYPAFKIRLNGRIF